MMTQYLSVFDGFHICIINIHIIPKVHRLTLCKILSYEESVNSGSDNDFIIPWKIQNPYLVVARQISLLYFQNQLCIFLKFLNQSLFVRLFALLRFTKTIQTS